MRQLTAAQRFHDDYAALDGATAADLAIERAATLIKFERVRRLGVWERRLYDRYRRDVDGLGKDAKATVDDVAAAPPLASYVGAWVLVVAVVAWQVAYLLQTGTRLGNRGSRAWLVDVAFLFAVENLVAVPFQIYFFEVWLPGLLSEHFKKHIDPTLLRSFPWKTRFPDSETFLIVRRHPELQATRLGSHVLGRLHRKHGGDRVDRVLEDLPGIERDASWRPSPRTRAGLLIARLILAMPRTIVQEVVIEEVVVFLPFVSAVVFSALPVARTSRRGGGLGALLVFLGIYVLLATAYVLAAVVGLAANYLGVHGFLAPERNARDHAKTIRGRLAPSAGTPKRRASHRQRRER